MGKDTGAGVLNPFQRTRYATWPGQTPEEAALAREQAESLRTQREMLDRQYREQQLLSEFSYKEAGLKPIRDPQTGQITGFERMTDAELSPEQRRQRQIQQLQEERSLAALKGELPVDPALMRDLGTQEQTLNEALRKQLGSGYATSSPGMEALQRFGESKNIVLENARRGDLTTAEALSLSRAGFNQQAPAANIAALYAPSVASTASLAGYGQLTAGYNTPLNRMLTERAYEGQTSQFNAQQWLNRRKAVAQTVASIFGSTMGGK